MSRYSVMLAIASGARFDTGRRVSVIVMAADRLDAALRAEQSVDAGLGDVEYSHAKSVRLLQSPAVLAMAA